MQRLSKGNQQVALIRELVSAYHVLIPLKGIDFVQSLFWENESDFFLYAFEDNHVTDNMEDRENAVKLLAILGTDIGFLTSQAQKICQRWKDLTGIIVFTFVKIFCYNDLYDFADEFLSAFMPKCYFDAPHSAYYFIDALIHRTERYDLLCKHFPIFLKAWGTGENRVDVGILTNNLYWSGLFLTKKKIPANWREKLASIYLEFAKDYLHNHPPKVDRDDFSRAVKYAEQLNPVLWKAGLKLRWQFFKRRLAGEL